MEARKSRGDTLFYAFLCVCGHGFYLATTETRKPNTAPLLNTFKKITPVDQLGGIELIKAQITGTELN